MIEKVRIPRRVWTLIHLTLIVWIAYILSGTINSQLARYIEQVYSNNKSSATFTQASSRPFVKRKANYFSIVQRNIFDSSQVVAKLPEDSLGAPGGLTSTTPAADAPKTTLNLQLVGTILVSTGDYRLAAIQVKGAKEQKLYKIGDSVSGAAIVSVERNRVGLLNNGRLEILEIDYSKSSSAKSGAGRMGGAAGLGLKDVVESGENNYLVSRRYADSQLKNMSRLLTQVRAVPNMDKSGVTNGFKLFSIKKGSLFSRIGFKNHDVVQRINGVEINSAEKGLELFQALRNESSFEIDLLRKKQKTSLRFSIQ